MRHLCGSTIALLILLGNPASSDVVDADTLSDFQLVIRHSAGELTSLNFAFGRGTDVQFFSNINDLGTWSETDANIRTGTLNPDSKNRSVVLGVCSGGSCEVSEGISFTSPVGISLTPQ